VEDIEAEIKREVEAIRKLKTKALFRPIKIDVQCGMNLTLPYYVK